MDLAKSLSLLTYYQTSLRNIGLFTSLSFGALGYSRFYRGKIWFINILLILVSMVFIISTLGMIHFLRNDMEIHSTLEQTEMLNKRMIIPNIIEYVNYGLLLVALYILYVQIK
jgi:hypothetical protein